MVDFLGQIEVKVIVYGQDNVIVKEMGLFFREEEGVIIY